MLEEACRHWNIRIIRSSIPIHLTTQFNVLITELKFSKTTRLIKSYIVPNNIKIIPDELHTSSPPQPQKQFLLSDSMYSGWNFFVHLVTYASLSSQPKVIISTLHATVIDS